MSRRPNHVVRQPHELDKVFGGATAQWQASVNQLGPLHAVPVRAPYAATTSAMSQPQIRAQNNGPSPEARLSSQQRRTPGYGQDLPPRLHRADAFMQLPNSLNPEAPERIANRRGFFPVSMLCKNPFIKQAYNETMNEREDDLSTISNPFDGPVIKHDPQPLTKRNLAKLHQRFCEADTLAELAKVKTKYPHGLPPGYEWSGHTDPADASSAKKTLKWLADENITGTMLDNAIYKTVESFDFAIPMLIHDTLLSANSDASGQGYLDNIPDDANIAGVDIAFGEAALPAVEYQNDGKYLTNGRENVSAEVACQELFEEISWRGNVDDSEQPIETLVTAQREERQAQMQTQMQTQTQRQALKQTQKQAQKPATKTRDWDDLGKRRRDAAPRE